MVVSRFNGNTVGRSQIGGYILSDSKKDNAKFKYDYFRLKILYDEILLQLRPPMTLYNDAEFENFMNSMPDVLQLTRTLNNKNTFFMDNPTALNSYKYEDGLVNKYIFVSNRLIDTLKQAMSEYIKIKYLQDKNAELKSYKEILEDREKLFNYLEEQNNTSHIFSAEATLTTNIEIKLWYKVYLQRHGPPNDGVFNSELLAEIIEELIASGEVSQDELIF